MSIIATVEHVFTSSLAGTPPFNFGFHISLAEDTDGALLTSFADAVATAYQGTIRQNLTDALNTGNVIVTTPDPSGERVFTAAIGTGTGAGSTTPPGCSFRWVFDAPRPPKARANAMYLPLASPGLYDADGSVHSSVNDNAVAWGGAILDACGDLGGAWVAIHQVGGKSAPIVTKLVTGAHSAPTVSFLRKRYR
jgi:hypothetical protein